MKEKTINRNKWGAIVSGDGYNEAQDILLDAIAAGIIAKEYCDVDRKHRGSALNYDLYDYADGVVLVQQRHTICSKYGNNPQKNYLLLIKTGDSVAVATAPHKMMIVRAAKLNPEAGYIIQKIARTKKADELYARFIAAPRLQGQGKEVT